MFHNSNELPHLPISAYPPQGLAYSRVLSIVKAFKAHSEYGVVFNSSALLQSIRQK